MTTPNANGYKPTFEFLTIPELLAQPIDKSESIEAERRERRKLEALWEWERTGVWPKDPDEPEDDHDDESMMAPEGGDVRFCLMSRHNFSGLGECRITKIPDGATFPSVGCELNHRRLGQSLMMRTLQIRPNKCMGLLRARDCVSFALIL